MSADRPPLDALLARLSRRGKLEITVEDGMFVVRLTTPGPFVNGRCTTDQHDVFNHCRLGAHDWAGEGTDLAEMLVRCDIESRPDTTDVDDLVAKIEYRRSTRTAGPPLPTYQRWHGWSPGIERWLSTFDHKYEYIAGYLRDLRIEREFEAENERRSARMAGAR